MTAIFKNPESWEIAGVHLRKRLFLGSSRYPSLKILKETLEATEVEVVTVSLRREGSQGKEQEGGFFSLIKDFNLRLLPNTAGCRSAEEAITVAQMAREVFGTHWIKLEVSGNEYALNPHPFELVKAAALLVKEGFEVFPYTTTDLSLAEELLKVGCRILMPWAAPIGSGLGPGENPWGLEMMRRYFPGIPLIVDAGLGRPSHAAQVMELGVDAVLLNSAVALAQNPQEMACAFELATRAGRYAYKGGMMETRQFAIPSTPLVGRPFWHEN